MYYARPRHVPAHPVPNVPVQQGLPDMFRNARAVVIGVEIALLKSRRRVRISVVCGKEPIVGSATLAV